MTKLALACLLSVLVTTAEAKLDRATFAEFVKRSDLIVRARSVSAFNGAHSSGAALLEVQEVIFGEYKPKTISLSWSSEVHEQPISEVGRVYILFLRPSEGGGGWEQAVYGRSYWKIDVDKSLAEVVQFAYPITMVEVPEALLVQTKLMTERWPDAPQEIAATCVSVPKLIQDILVRKGRTPSKPK